MKHLSSQTAQRSSFVGAAAFVVLGWLGACSLANKPGEPTRPSGHATGGSSAQGGAGGEGGQGCGPLDTLAHCGACNTPCSPAGAVGADCSSGSCNYATCVAPALDCDNDRTNGCETDPATSAEHCGACNQPCSATVANATGLLCQASSCDYTACAGAFADCDNNRPNGCERPANTLSDCGGCDVPCAPGNATGPDCSSGTCTYSACAQDFQDCDGNTANGCESSRLSDHDHCGSCINPCQASASCISGQCLSVHPQCGQPYNLLSGADRNVGTGAPQVYCDIAGGGSPEWQGPGWYRFTGAAGSQMPQGVPPVSHCSTDAPGWLNGSHPTQAQGVVPATVCFNWSGNNCMWSSPIQIVNCAGFYLYYLPDAPVCSLRYCGA